MKIGRPAQLPFWKYLLWWDDSLITVLEYRINLHTSQDCELEFTNVWCIRSTLHVYEYGTNCFYSKWKWWIPDVNEPTDQATGVHTCMACKKFQNTSDLSFSIFQSHPGLVLQSNPIHAYDWVYLADLLAWFNLLQSRQSNSITLEYHQHDTLEYRTWSAV